MHLDVQAWKRLALCGAAMAGLAAGGIARSQSTTTPEDEFRQLIRVNQDISPLGENPFGEAVSLYNGTLSFRQTDIDLAGTGPRLQLSRTFTAADASDPFYRPFVDWRLEVPHIETLVADSDSFFAASTDRCSNFRQAPTVVATSGATPRPVFYFSSKWWHGYQLVIPEQGNQDLLKRDASNTLSPQMTQADGSARTFGIVTKQHWQASCLAQTSNGQAGEGFLVVSPDGTKYWMDWLIQRPATNVGFLQPGFGGLGRHVAMMMASRQEDRFGNSLTYSYDGNGDLTSIQASDGRSLTISYESWQPPNVSSPVTRVHSATLQPSNSAPRTWTYSYGNDGFGRLAGVQLPDGTSWSYSLGSFRVEQSQATILYDTNDGCTYTLRPENAVTLTGTIQHPSGLTGTFTTRSTIRGRSNVQRACDSVTSGGTTGGGVTVHTFLEAPNVYATAALVTKQFSGAGLATPTTWTYAYSPPNQSWSSDCATGCASTVWTDVTDPSGNAARHTFSNSFDATESQLLGTDYYAGAVGGTLVRQEVHGYASPTTGPWPVRFGSTLQSFMNAAQLEQLSPENLLTIHQDGDAYAWQAETFGDFGRALTVKRSNNIAGQQATEERISYLNDLPHWVVGLPLQVDNLTKGEVVSANSYDLSNVTLQSRSRFGQKLMSYTYDAQGLLASFTDGNNNATTLGSYKRGIPQSIHYPDNTSQSLVVDDFGQIASMTDQAGSTTSYSYDPVGRLTGITYPSGDEAAWHPQSSRYVFVTSAERGLAANHWQRIVTKGNAVTTTFYDVMLRPVLSDVSISGTNTNLSTVTGYDWRNQKIFSAYPVSSSPSIGATLTGVTTTYDALGRLTQTQQDSELGALTTTVSYLPGARQQVTDPKGNTTTVTYQVFDQPSYDTPIQMQAPEGINQEITRDLYGNPHAIRQWGNGVDVTKKLAYDSFHRLCRTAEPETGSEVMAYDTASNLAWTASGLSINAVDDDCARDQVPDAAKTTRSYDAMNRVLTLAPPSGTQGVTYTYDPLGKVATSTSGVSTWSSQRNKLGQLTSETLSVSGNGANVLRYAHDAYGSLRTASYPDGLVVDYAPDALGRPTQAGTYATNVGYFPDGNLEQFTYGNGTDYLAQRNARQLMSNFSYAKAGTLKLSEDFAYDANGNITGVTDLAGGPRSKSFGYDALNRLTAAQASGLWGAESYTYDPLSNISSRTSGGQTFAYNYDGANHLASITSGGSTINSFGYDTRGNLTSKNSSTLVFDARNQLLQIPGISNYAYDANGRRVVKTPTGGASTYYFYNDAGQLLYQFDAGTTKTTDFIYLGKKLIVRNEGYTTVILGTIDGVAIDGSGNASIGGWACSSSLAASVNVDLYAGGPVGAGTFIGRYAANQSSEAAVAQACGVSSGSFRFSIPLATAMRSQYAGQGIYIHGISPVGNSNSLLTNSGNYVVPAMPTAPAAPASITAAAAGDQSSIAVAWSSSAGATSYVLQQQLNGGTWSQVQSGTQTSYTLSSPADGNYVYQVQACNAVGCSSVKVAGAVTIARLPVAPVSISVPGTSSGAISVSWPAGARATSYTLEQSFNGGAWSAIYNGSATSSSFSVSSTGSYGYRVKSCNALGCSGYTTSGTVAVTIPPGSAPSLSVPASSANGSYTVSWGGVAGASSYTLQEQVNGGGWTTVQANGATSWGTSGRGSATYGYQVQACNAGGCGPWSSVANVSVILPPGVPTGLSASVGSSPINPVVTVSWNAVAGATQYNVQQSDPRNGTTNPYSGSTTTFGRVIRVNGVVSFKVQACNASGCSAWSGSVSVTLASG